MWGIDRLSGGRHSLVRKRLRNGTTAVLTHNAALDRRGRSTLDVLDELGVVPSILFSPEHGLDGAAQAEEAVPSLAQRSAAPDEASGVPSDRGLPTVVSLYGSDRESLTPQDSHLSGIDNLVIDLVDVGSRYYTYVWTALLAARKAASLGVHTVILDRPNPLGSDPSQLEGKPQSDGFLSFVGLEPLAIRHGLTVGEILTLFLARDGITPGPDGAFSVVACKGWERYRSQLAWGRPFIPPSPNMPSLETAQLYPGACLVEGTNLSEGRGTSFPFRVVGSPFLDGSRLAKDLDALHLPGVLVRPTTFKPTFEKHAGQTCHGVMLHITNPASFRPVATYLSLITVARTQAPEQFAFRTQAYEFEQERPAFDLLTGSATAREAILAGATANEVSELISPVGPDVTGLWNLLQDDFAKATAQPNAHVASSQSGVSTTASHLDATRHAPSSAEERSVDASELDSSVLNPRSEDSGFAGSDSTGSDSTDSDSTDSDSTDLGIPKLGSTDLGSIDPSSMDPSSPVAAPVPEAPDQPTT